MDNSNNMTTSNSPNPDAPRDRKIHPLVATAAGAVIIASLAATAAVTGLFPKASSTSPTNDQTQAAQVATQPAVTQPAEPTAAQQQQAQQDQLAQQQAQQRAAAQAAAQQQQQQQPAPPQMAQQQPVPAQQPNYAQQQPAQPAYCSTCGTVEAISAVRHEGQGTGIGAVGGAVAGGLIGNQFGRGGGRTGMTILGALGGGLGGNAVEKHLRSETDYSVRVRMESGKTRYFTYRQAPPFSQGQRVRIENGTLAAG